MAEVTFEYKLMFDNTWVYNYASFIEKHCWPNNPNEHKKLLLPHLFSEGYLKHWTLEEGFSAIYNSYVQKMDVRFKITSEQNESYYFIYFDLSESPVVANFNNVSKEHDAGVYNVYYCMSGSNTEFLVHNNNRAHGLQLLIKREAFDAYFTHSGDNAANLNHLSHLLDPARFRGTMQMDSRLIMALMQLPKHACEDELDIYHVKGYIYNILSRFLQQLLAPAASPTGSSLTGIGRLIEVNEEIARKLEEEHPSLEEAARRSCMCSTKFKKLFRLAYKTTYHKYHQKIKLQRARELFQTSNTSVMTVVRDLGYKNAGHFARLFKELFKISPKEYQKQFDAIV